MKFIEHSLVTSAEFQDALQFLRDRKNIQWNAVSEAQKAHMTYLTLQQLKKRGVFVTSSELVARKVYEDLSFFYKEDVLYYPADEVMLHNVEAMSHDASYDRLCSMQRILEEQYMVVVCSVQALLRKLMPVEKFRKQILQIDLSSSIELTAFIQNLVILGYERVDMVEGKGHFSIRGGIVDIFPVHLEYAVRVELFDDAVDSIRFFDVGTQRSLHNIEAFSVFPAREIVLQTKERDEGIQNILQAIQIHSDSVRKSASCKFDENGFSMDVSRLKEEYYFAGMDRYSPFFLQEGASILEYFQDAILFLDDPARIEQSLEVLDKEFMETCNNLLERGTILPKSIEAVWTGEQLTERFKKVCSVQLRSFQTPRKLQIEASKCEILVKSTPTYAGKIEMMMEDIRFLQKKGYAIVILAGPKGRAERLAEGLGQEGIQAVYFEEYDFLPSSQVISITHGSLSHGFEYTGMKFCIFSEKEIFGQDKKKKHRFLEKNKKGKKIDIFTDLKVGDYIVHYSHGIGQFIGVEQLVVEKIKKDYIKIRYHGKDNLYLPIDQIDLIQKFIGSEGKLPKLNKLGGADWSKTREKVKESLRELAGELIRLYAEREASKGHAYPKDTIWQKQMEDLFPYEETEDQLRCIEDIKKDMETQRPMDRLLCGDVGFGKTEVAIRAVFKAVMDGKQVAYLVPTTVLAQQQYTNFKERMKDFPVNIEVLSRFKTAAEQKKVLKAASAGNVDILIGTHRLLQKDIRFKDLGLLVVDEEQRFGVSHKEKLKTLLPNVDVLTLTATPIPRTLHMSLVGIRDISIIEEPPENRHPVETFVMEHEAETIRSAIVREMGRGGQIFYLYNHVRGIEIKAAEIMKLVPEARVAIAHGQMEEGKLETVMQGFIQGEYDVMVCSTIIESGLDLPNVNTMIVEESDKLGLAQLYQIRGRVGRSNRIAYAYLTYKKDKVLSEIAEKRLQAIKEFTELGSGFKIAMRDLEIRGAGNLLGSQQHGHMDAVGYDMYIRLLEESVKELKGEKKEDVLKTEILLDIKANAFIDDVYISSEVVRMETYKKIAAIQNEEDRQDLEDELIDRFGEIPLYVNNLITIAEIKALAEASGICSISQKDSSVLFYPTQVARISPVVFHHLMVAFPKRLFYTATGKPYLTLKIGSIPEADILQNIKIVLQKLKNIQQEEYIVYNKNE